jgi:hypothetical protein
MFYNNQPLDYFYTPPIGVLGLANDFYCEQQTERLQEDSKLF